jgi:NADPH-dependent 2,4-dienoyl-CoA reductase/sulfur reductase-like enzyme/rhodanese-related sulfurtransferase
MKICIVGGVAGGASAAARLRRLDESAEIIMFERGPYISFANCGLPYHISGKIKKRDHLLLQTPQSFNSRFNVDVRVQNEVIGIDKDKKILTIKSMTSGEDKIYEESYDKLILSPGASPFVPPIKGKEAPMFMGLRDVPDMDKIIKHIREHRVKNAVVIGAGFIGIEVAENLSELGITTTVVELQDQVLPMFDKDMANILSRELLSHKVNLILSDAVTSIDGEHTGKVILKSGRELVAELVIGAIGVKPEISLAKAAGLKIGDTGGVWTDEYMKTSDDSIYAVGDAVEITHYVQENPMLIPLAGPANKQGRIAANNICNLPSTYKNTLGTGIVKVFNLTAAATGINEKLAKKEGINYQAIHLHPNNHAGYYPNASSIALKVIFDKDTAKILGAQGIGIDGVDKRIDVLATAIRAGMTVYDLQELELCYAPPFGSAKDPVNMAGFVGSNILQGTTESMTWDQAKNLENSIIVDVRTESEFAFGSIPGSLNIPVDDLRDRMDELPKDKNIIITCRVGVRGHTAARILKNKGFEKVSNLSGGYLSYCNYNFTIN